MKKRIKDAVDEYNKAVDEVYRTALNQWNIASGVLDRELELLCEEDRLKRKDLGKEVMALKIVVPNRLKECFDYLQTLG